MSAKLLYSMSDDNQNLKKQIGCINGLLQFLDPHHLISHRSINRTIPPDDSKQHGKTVRNASKKSKEKHLNIAKEKQVNAIEPSRLSIASSTSTIILLPEYDWAKKPQHSPFTQTICNGGRQSSREAAVYESKYLDSPRLSHSTQTDSPRLSALSESFRSISSNRSTPTITNDNYNFTSKLRDLPRLSLDSKQRIVNDSVHVSKDDLLQGGLKTKNALREPATCRTSNVIAKLMGLEDDATRTIEGSDLFSRSSRTLESNKANHVLQFPRNTAKEARGSWPNKVMSEQQVGKSKSINHPLTIYGEIEKRLADLDFQKSGKDLRALKQILESLHKEKNKLDIKMENQSQQIDSSSFHITQKQILNKVSPSKVKGVVKSNRKAKSTEVVKVSRNEATHIVQDLPLLRLQRLKIVQPVDGKKASVPKRTAKDVKESHNTLNKYSRERTPRSIIGNSQAPESKTKASLTSSSRISNNRHSRVKQMLPQKQNLTPNLSLLQGRDDQSSESSNYSAYLSQRQNPNPLASRQQMSDKKNSVGTQSATAYEDLTITIREQPSPVSVLDASFYDDESPSPVKKKPTALRDNAIFSAAVWKDTYRPTFSGSTKPGFSNDTDDYQKLETAPPIWKMSSHQHGITRNTTPIYSGSHLEKTYISEILVAAGILDDQNHQELQAINPKLFFTLEHARGRDSLSDSGRENRKLLFDAVNEILSKILVQSRSLLKKQSGLVTRGPRLLQEILRKLDQLQPINSPHDLDEEEAFLTSIIEKDLTQRSANWTDISLEMPALVLDIERMVFRDLIAELVHDNAQVQVQTCIEH